jgi:hypothetical protein
MAALTWREVSAPDLGTSIRGVGQFTDILNQTLQNAKGMVSDVDAGITDRNNTAALRIAAAAGTSDQAKEILASQAIMGNARLTAPTIAALAARPGQLTNQALGETNLDASKLALDMTKYADGRNRNDNTLRDTAAGAIAKIAAASATGDPAKIAAAQAQYGAAATAVPYADILGNAKGVQGLEGGAVGIAADRLGMVRTGVGIEGDKIENANKLTQGEQMKFNLQSGRQTYEDGRTADALMGTLGLDSMDADTARSTIQGLRGKVPPNVIGMIMGRANALNPGTFGSADLPAGVSMGGGSGDGMGTMNYQARGAGFGAVPDSIKTMGQASAYADRINAAGVPSSAMGPYQIVGNTRDGVAKQLFGAGWRDQPYSPENERKIAARIFQQNNSSGAALRKQWVSLSGPGEADRVAKMPVDQALNYIAQKESGASVGAAAAATLNNRASATRDTARAGIQMAARNSQFQSQGISTGRISAAYNDDADANTVVDRLIAGRFKGQDAGQIEARVLKIMNEARVNAATAGAILEQSKTRQTPGAISRFMSTLRGEGGDVNAGINSYTLRDLTQAARAGGFERKIDGGQSIQQLNAGVQQAQSKAESASGRLQAAINRGLPPAQIQRLTLQAQQAESTLRALQSRAAQYGPTRD